MSRAAYYGSQGRYSKAILNCNEVLKIHPNSAQAYFYRGILKYQNKVGLPLLYFCFSPLKLCVSYLRMVRCIWLFSSYRAKS